MMTQSFNRSALTAALLATSLAPALAAAQHAKDEQTLILYNGRIHVMDDNNRVVDAIALRGNTVLAVGNEGDVRALAKKGQAVEVDLKGRTVLPGLIDGNIHGTRNAYYCWTSNIRIDFISDRNEALRQISRTAEANARGTWLWTTRLPAVFHVNGLSPPGMFTLAELDRAAPNNPVMIMANGFGLNAQLNSAAIKALDLKAGDLGVELGEGTGTLTGKVAMPALDRARTAISRQFEAASLGQQASCYLDFSHAMNRAGLTSYAGAQQGGIFNAGAWSANAGVPGARLAPEADAPRATPAYREKALAEGVLPTSIDRGWAEPNPMAMPRFDYDGNPHRDGLNPVNELDRAGLLSTRVLAMLDPRGGGIEGVKATVYHSVGMMGNDRVRIGGIGPGFYMGQVRFGNTATLLPPKDYRQIIETLACNRWNWTDQTYIEATVRYKLDVIEAVNRTCPIAGLRWSFEGIQEPLAQASLDRIRKLGIGVTTFSTNIQGRSPLPDVAGPTPFADLVRSGVKWCMGSDGTLGNPSDPFGHMWYAVTGETMDPNGLKQPPSQRISRLEALKAKTVNCRFHLQNDRIGSLRPGDLADLIVLSDDYFTVPETDIRYLHSLLTIMDGNPVYAEGPFSSLDDPFVAKIKVFKDNARVR
ncbi:amidohydrolase family protein [Sphingobium algorifonticola]|uniref:Amidohydrolase 3 domain-containing protein n=1 Tax=Sphingobium algorifonticola TaxID=2008318 RepID=A0A437JAE9_9SPHN|nr:amidohydrolase family protein [Sphingobium algorifonticola]RVT42340.1 hypothetical protein ENE74_09105 [Sphingobium algorifonticola]